MIVAGEASGDRHAARLVHEIENQIGRACQFFGCAGPEMRAAGVDAVVKSDEMSIVGVAEIVKALPMFLGAMRKLKKAATDRKPTAVILVDFPDFNLRLAKWLKKQGFTVIYYISPQLWAWRRYRIRTIKRYVDLLLVILPFEKTWYEKHGVEGVVYVGNPLARTVRPSRMREEFLRDFSLPPDRRLVAILPGSRHHEIVNILPTALNAARELVKRHSDLHFVIAVRRGSNRSDVDSILQKSSRTEIVSVVEGATLDALAAADAAIVTSGTATLEAGIIGTPMVIVYRASWLNYFLLRPLISVEHYGLVNLIAEKRVATELIQGEMTPTAIASEIERLLEPSVNSDVRNELAKVAAKLGTGNSAAAAAKAILDRI